MSDMDLSVRIVCEARSWIGTPYMHQASVKSVGCDCLGLVTGIWRELGGKLGGPLPPYTSDWGEIDKCEHVLAAAGEHMIPLARPQARAGDLVIFRWRSGTIAKHMGIMSGEDRFIHAWERAGVVEAVLVPQWRKRIAAVFRFPAIV